MGEVSDDLNKHCSSFEVLVGFDVQRIVRECLISFPYIWASVGKDLICGTCLIILDVARLLLVGECRLLFTFFEPTDLTMLVLRFLVREWLPYLVVLQEC